MPVYDKLCDYEDRIHHVLVRHEQGAIHAAEGFARVSGEPGVVIVTSGPGATNVITGVADAMTDSTPVVVITGQVSTAALGTDAFADLIQADCARSGVDTSLSFVFNGAASSAYLFIADASGDMHLAVNDMEICARLTPDALSDRLDALNAMIASGV